MSMFVDAGLRNWTHHLRMRLGESIVKPEKVETSGFRVLVFDEVPPHSLIVLNGVDQKFLIRDVDGIAPSPQADGHP